MKLADAGVGGSTVDDIMIDHALFAFIEIIHKFLSVAATVVKCVYRVI